MKNTMIFRLRDRNGDVYSIEIPMSEPIFNEDGSVTGTVTLPSKHSLIPLFEAQGLELDADGRPTSWKKDNE